MRNHNWLINRCNTSRGKGPKEPDTSVRDFEAAMAKVTAGVEDKCKDHMHRHVARYLVLTIEASMTQTQLQNALTTYALGTMRGGSVAGNVTLTFDANLFGESITAPHVRKPPLQQPIVTKMWKAIKAVRAEGEQSGITPMGDVLIAIDGGR